MSSAILVSTSLVMLLIAFQTNFHPGSDSFEALELPEEGLHAAAQQPAEENSPEHSQASGEADPAEDNGEIEELPILES